MPEFDVVFEKGELRVGDSFRVYETHHPVDVTVKTVRHDQGDVATLVCDQGVYWDGARVGTRVDTDNPRAALKYGYGFKD